MTISMTLSQYDTLKSVLDAQRTSFNREGFPSAEVRKERLERLVSMLQKYNPQICEALDKDFGCRSKVFSSFADVASVIGNARQCQARLSEWMAVESREAPEPFEQVGARGEVHYQPKGVIGVIGPWNYPLHLTLVPLTNILAAGNRAMIKPSELTPVTSAVLVEGIAEFFDETEVAVIQGDAGISAQFASLPFDHLVFTGSTMVGRHVMRAAAENLTPVTLELGGKSPVIIGRDADIELTARRLMGAKMINSGQFCVSPDHVYVPTALRDELVNACIRALGEMYPSFGDNPDYVSVINDRHYQRLQALVDDARERGLTVVEVNPANENYDQAASRKMLPKIVLDAGDGGAIDESAIMGEEIFGPLIAFISYDNIDAVIHKIQHGPRPLAIYYYGENECETETVLHNTISGGVTVNDSCWHVASHDMPLGGVGDSGMGRYHGRDGFREFSNQRAVLIQTPVDEVAGLFRAPYSDALKMTLEQIINGNV